ncbi:MAG TPA: protein kinase [Myxococcaceae bacterium]|nr:protein kinase [Myxococcaceae bacterium]
MTDAKPVPGRNSGAIPPNLVGTQLGSFLLTRQLGRGGMGAVYLGEHVLIGSKVAVKVLHPHLAVHADLVARFFAEARAVNVIGHENIVSIFDMAVQKTIHYFIMEYLEGQSLAQLADSSGVVPASVAMPILAQVCDGLGAAHARGVIHRDLKPENIFLTPRSGQPHFVKVLDFGIAKLFADLTEVHTRPGAIVGTPEYMAPEQANGEKVDGRIDLYALGIIGYRLATGALPFTAPTMPQVLIKQRDQIPTPPIRVVPSTDPGFSDIIMRALKKDPDQRFQTAAEFRQALLNATARLRRPTHELPAVEISPPPAGEVDSSGPPTILLHPSSKAAIRARVTEGASWLLGPLECTDVSRAGLFVATEAKPPPLMTRLSLMLELDGEEWRCEGDVVRHVTGEQARAWGMSAGFALQFAELPPALRERLEAQQTGRLPNKAPAGAALKVTPEIHARAEAILSRLREVKEEDPYQLLDLALDVSGREARQRAVALGRELEQLGAHALSPAHEEERRRQQVRVRRMGQQLSVPLERLELDLPRGNWRGIARALDEGLTADALDRARESWLNRNPSAAARARIHQATGQAWEGRGDAERALQEYERGLAADPANVPLHQRRRQLLTRREGRAPDRP